MTAQAGGRPAPVTARGLAIYGAGAFGASILLQTILLWFVYFYAPPAGQGIARLPPTLVGFALAAGRAVNAFSNPPVAFWSDRFRSRWGRRRPFIAAGAPVLAAFFALLWLPPAAPTQVLFVYTACVLAAFFFFFSFVMNPYAAMLPEITPGGAGREAAASWQAGAALAGVGISIIASPWLVTHWGFGTMGVILAALALALLWSVGAGPAPRGDPPGPGGRAFMSSIVDVLRNRPFRVYLLSLALLWLGTSMVNTTIVYAITVLMGLPKAQVGFVLGVAFVCTLAALPLLARLNRRVGTPRSLAWTLGITSVIVPLVGAIGLPRLPFGPPVQGYIVVVLASAPLAALLVLPNVLLADIAEADRTASGTGREAMFYAVQGLVLNAATAVAAVLLGVLLTLGYSPGRELGLRIIPLVAGGCTLAALLAFRRYPRSSGPTHRGAPSD